MQGRINSFEGAFYGMLFSGHLTIFAITFFSIMIQILKLL
jgi:hypothetical protein